MATTETASPYYFEALAPSHDRTGFKERRRAVGSLLRKPGHPGHPPPRIGLLRGRGARERHDRRLLHDCCQRRPDSRPRPATAKKLPRYPLIPAVRVGRLAVAESHRGKGLGAGLLLDAIGRALRSEVAAFAIVVDAKDDAAAAFYRRFRFIPFASAPMSLYLPLAEVARSMGLKAPGETR